MTGKIWLENVLGRRVISFCYTRGKFNARIAAPVKQAGFTAARTCRFNLSAFPRNPFYCGVSTHAAPHSKFIQLAHALRQQNFIGAWNFFCIRKGSTEWQTHFLYALDHVEADGGIAYVYLHSWEIDHEKRELLETRAPYERVLPSWLCKATERELAQALLKQGIWGSLWFDGDSRL